MADPSPEIACTLPEVELRARVRELRAGIARRVTETRELPDGVALALPAGAEDEAHEFVAFEQQCCGFARFAVRAEADAVWVEIRGPEGTRDFVRGMLAPEAPLSAARG